ncbi:hypothetical protein PIB30_004108 [Stylosanthes scabra]|uniref:CCHC-type domain-containing protein n=1 Tax=Stylosanthes scabra TaxID=79078 RepID=A0ABU6Z5L8_9FABA|nr:hypothetical protein [Stylosanthes scabra]
MDSIRATYEHFIKPVNIEHYWTPTYCSMTLPPPIKRPAHRPKKKRRADVAVEKEMNANKVRKTFEVTCNKCGQNGHYYRTCKNPPLDPNWKPMTKKERRAAQGKSTTTTKKSKDTNSQHGNSSQGVNQNVEGQTSGSLGLQLAARMKQPIIRPQIAPTDTAMGANGVSAETIVSTSSGTAARLFKFMPTPGFKTPRQK